jgi:hypothetical protein
MILISYKQIIHFLQYVVQKDRERERGEKQFAELNQKSTC